MLELVDRLFSESYVGRGKSCSLASTPNWLPQLFRRYCDALVKANRLDFGSLLYFAARLLRDRPAVARVLRLSWTHVCVDEFQDTNRAQYDLLRLLAPAKGHNLFVVADDDQIIYQWNGASPRRFRDLRSDYDVRTLELPENYRCPPAIVALANRLIARNKRRISDRRTVAVREHDGTYPAVVRCEVLPTPERETEFVAGDIEDRGLRPGDCVVLGRTNRLIRSAADTLSHAGYEACVPRKKSEFNSPALNVLVEALRLANSRHDRVVLRRICLAWEGLTGVAIEPQAVSAAAALVGGDFLRAWVEVTAAAGAGSSEIVLNHLRNELVDALRFPETVERFLDGEWRAWNGEDLGDDLGDPVEEEVRTWKALHRDIVSEYGSNAGTGDVDPEGCRGLRGTG